MAKLVVAKLPELIQTAGSFGSINFTSLTCGVTQQTNFGVSATTTSFDAPISVTAFDGTYQQYDLFDVAGVSRAVMSSGGHELAIQGPVTPLQIKLDNSTGNVGDMIVRTVDGPRWQQDYYSTVYNLYNQPVIEIDNEFLFRVVDPRKGFTQFAGNNPTTSNEDYVSEPDLALVFVKGLPTDRLWRVRLHVWVDNWREFSSIFLDSNSASSSTFDVYGLLHPVGKHNCSANDERDLYSGSSHLFEFFTYDGGNNWYWTRLTGYQECG